MAQRDNILIRFSHGTAMHFAKGTTLLDMSKNHAIHDLYAEPIAGAIVDNMVRDLQTQIRENSLVTFFPINTPLGMEAYRRTLTFVLIMAVEELYPTSTVRVEHALSKGLYCEVGLPEIKLTRQITKQIRDRMKEIIEEDRTITRHVYDRMKVIEQVSACSSDDERARLLCQLDQSNATIYSPTGDVPKAEREDTVTVYQCDKHYVYLYGPMLPRTGYLKKFDLMYYAPGVILRYPMTSPREMLPAFIDRPKLAEIFAESEEWANIMKCPYVADLNRMVEDGTYPQLIRLAEALHEKKIAQIADMVLKRGKSLRLILIAGPSSSGKTTFAQRLSIQLRVNGINPVSISVDDYFHNRDETPLDEQGNYDFESIDAVDLALLNDHLVKLL
ncbi:MAG: nucleoside kinase, partial [Selenomonadales bacterium]|nr:nucleoside kinase [Selenomonadales bacterium]